MLWCAGPTRPGCRRNVEEYQNDREQEDEEEEEDEDDAVRDTSTIFPFVLVIVRVLSIRKLLGMAWRPRSLPLGVRGGGFGGASGGPEPHINVWFL